MNVSKEKENESVTQTSEDCSSDEYWMPCPNGEDPTSPFENWAEINGAMEGFIQISDNRLRANFPPSKDNRAPLCIVSARESSWLIACSQLSLPNGFGGNLARAEELRLLRKSLQKISSSSDLSDVLEGFETIKDGNLYFIFSKVEDECSGLRGQYYELQSRTALYNEEYYSYAHALPSVHCEGHAAASIDLEAILATSPTPLPKEEIGKAKFGFHTAGYLMWDLSAQLSDGTFGRWRWHTNTTNALVGLCPSWVYSEHQLKGKLGTDQADFLLNATEDRLKALNAELASKGERVVRKSTPRGEFLVLLKGKSQRHAGQVSLTVRDDGTVWVSGSERRKSIDRKDERTLLDKILLEMIHHPASVLSYNIDRTVAVQGSTCSELEGDSELTPTTGAHKLEVLHPELPALLPALGVGNDPSCGYQLVEKTGCPEPLLEREDIAQVIMRELDLAKAEGRPVNPHIAAVIIARQPAKISKLDEDKIVLVMTPELWRLLRQEFGVQVDGWRCEDKEDNVVEAFLTLKDSRASLTAELNLCKELEKSRDADDVYGQAELDRKKIAVAFQRAEEAIANGCATNFDRAVYCLFGHLKEKLSPGPSGLKKYLSDHMRSVVRLQPLFSAMILLSGCAGSNLSFDPNSELAKKLRLRVERNQICFSIPFPAASKTTLNASGEAPLLNNIELEVLRQCILEVLREDLEIKDIKIKPFASPESVSMGPRSVEIGNIESESGKILNNRAKQTKTVITRIVEGVNRSSEHITLEEGAELQFTTEEWEALLKIADAHGLKGTESTRIFKLLKLHHQRGGLKPEEEEELKKAVDEKRHVEVAIKFGEREGEPNPDGTWRLKAVVIAAALANGIYAASRLLGRKGVPDSSGRAGNGGPPPGRNALPPQGSDPIDPLIKILLSRSLDVDEDDRIGAVKNFQSDNFLGTAALCQAIMFFDEPDIRVAALTRLTTVDRDLALMLAQVLLEDDSTVVRAAAFSLFAELNRDGATMFVAAMLEGARPSLLEDANHVTKELNQSALNSYRSILKKSGTKFSRKIAMREAREVENLRRLLYEPETSYSRRLYKKLAKQNSPVEAQFLALIAGLQSDNESVRRKAERGMEAFGLGESETSMLKRAACTAPMGIPR